MSRAFNLIEVMASVAIGGFVMGAAATITGETTTSIETQVSRMEVTRLNTQAAQPIAQAIQEARVEYVLRAPLPAAEQPSTSQPLWALVLPSARDGAGRYVVDGHLARYGRAILFTPRLTGVDSQGRPTWDLVRTEVEVDPESWSATLTIVSVTATQVTLSNGVTIPRAGGRVLISRLSRFEVSEPEPNGIIGVSVGTTVTERGEPVTRTLDVFARPAT